MPQPINAVNFIGTISANIDNEKLDDKEFRQFVRNTLSSVEGFMVKAKCKCDNKVDGLQDPEVTKGRFYKVIDSSVLIHGNEDPHISIVGNSGVEVTRPKHLFYMLEKK